MSKETDFLFVGPHADVLEGGRPVGPGDSVSLDDEGQKANKGLIDNGHLVKDETKPVTQQLENPADRTENGPRKEGAK